MHLQAAALLQKQDARSCKLLGQRTDSELRTQGVMCSPFFVAHPVCLLENNFSIDAHQNRSPKKAVGGFGADVCILLPEQFGSVRLAGSARGSDSEDDAQNGRVECEA